MTIADIKKDAETRMQKSVDALKHELQRLRTGRASTALVEHLKISYYGSDMPLTQVANVAVAPTSPHSNVRTIEIRRT